MDSKSCAMRVFLKSLSLILLVGCSTIQPVSDSCISRPKRGGMTCIDKDGNPIMSSTDPSKLAIKSYDDTDGDICMKPKEYQARLKAARAGQ